MWLTLASSRACDASKDLSVFRDQSFGVASQSFEQRLLNGSFMHFQVDGWSFESLRSAISIATYMIFWSIDAHIIIHVYYIYRELIYIYKRFLAMQANKLVTDCKSFCLRPHSTPCNFQKFNHICLTVFVVLAESMSCESCTLFGKGWA